MKKSNHKIGGLKNNSRTTTLALPARWTSRAVPPSRTLFAAPAPRAARRPVDDLGRSKAAAARRSPPTSGLRISLDRPGPSPRQRPRPEVGARQQR